MSSQISNLKSQIPNLFIVGFMASGKTTVGRALAERLHVPFIDLDERIVAAAGSTIAEMIARQGEAAFRQLETECLRQAITRETAVVSLGGGAFMQAANRELVAQAGVSIWLDALFDLCWERIQRDAVVRPLAANEEEARARFEQRIAIYKQAQMRVNIQAEDSSEAIAARILSEFS